MTVTTPGRDLPSFPKASRSMMVMVGLVGLSPYKSCNQKMRRDGGEGRGTMGGRRGMMGRERREGG